MQLSEWMTSNGYDDERFGAGVKADRVTINRIRRGVNKPSWDLAGRIKDFTDGAVSANDFLPAPDAAATCAT